MSYWKLVKSVTKLSSSLIPRRNASEYAKRMGYKFIEKDPEKVVQPIKSALYLIGSVLLVLTVVYDKQRHYEVFSAYEAERKRHFTPPPTFNPLDRPNMDFLFDTDFNDDFEIEK